MYSIRTVCDYGWSSLCVFFVHGAGLSLHVCELLPGSSVLIHWIPFINKGCTEAVCLYSSQCKYLSGDTVLQSWADTGVHSELPTTIYQHYSLHLLPYLRSSAQTNTHEHLLLPPESKGHIALTASQEELGLKGAKLSNSWWHYQNFLWEIWSSLWWGYSIIGW